MPASFARSFSSTLVTPTRCSACIVAMSWWSTCRLSTDRERTADEYGALLLPLFARLNLELGATDSVMVSSVVPPINSDDGDPRPRILSRTTALFIEPGIRTGMPIRYDNPAEVGADRIVNSVAAVELYGAPVVVVDFGTATTFDVVNPGW